MRAPLRLSLSLLALGTIGCGSSTDEGSEPGDPIAAGGAGPAAGGAPSESPPMDPEPVNGIAPCPSLESGYQGDERCILPPEPGTGAHIHTARTITTTRPKSSRSSSCQGRRLRAT